LFEGFLGFCSCEIKFLKEHIKTNCVPDLLEHEVSILAHGPFLAPLFKKYFIGMQ
jgi:hypothetical protein